MADGTETGCGRWSQLEHWSWYHLVQFNRCWCCSEEPLGGSFGSSLRCWEEAASAWWAKLHQFLASVCSHSLGCKPPNLAEDVGRHSWYWCICLCSSSLHMWWEMGGCSSLRWVFYLEADRELSERRQLASAHCKSHRCLRLCPMEGSFGSSQ